MIVTVKTSVYNQSPSTCLDEGTDFDADLEICDESGERHRWQGSLTYALDRSGALMPCGDSIDCWMSRDIMRAIETPWVAAHRTLVLAVVKSLGSGEGDEEFEVNL